MELKSIIKDKNSRLCFSADFVTKDELFKWINIVGPHICMLKTHIDILEDFDTEVITELIKLKKKYNFLICEDRKFGDIGKTFHKQLYGGMYKIGTWADIITIHGISSSGMLQSLDNLGIITPKILIVSQMSSQNNIIDSNYTQQCYSIALKYPNLVIGFISQYKFVDDDTFLFISPGIRNDKVLSLDQNYRSSYTALNEQKNDIIIVGSGIYDYFPKNNYKDCKLKQNEINKIILNYK
jgi:orotidine 5'-phosphate decarboxylase subfamily 1